MKALVFKNIVEQVEESEFPVASEMIWMDCTDECKSGWLLKDGVLIAPPVPAGKTYAENRSKEYNMILGEYLDGIVKNDQDQIDKYIEDCKAIKAKWPKDTSGPV